VTFNKLCYPMYSPSRLWLKCWYLINILYLNHLIDIYKHVIHKKNLCESLCEMDFQWVKWNKFCKLIFKIKFYSFGGVSKCFIFTHLSWCGTILISILTLLSTYTFYMCDKNNVIIQKVHNESKFFLKIHFYSFKCFSLKFIVTWIIKKLTMLMLKIMKH
jgi:hypothetical protein